MRNHAIEYYIVILKGDVYSGLQLWQMPLALPEAMPISRTPEAILSLRTPEVTQATKSPEEASYWTRRLASHQNSWPIRPEDQRENRNQGENTHTTKTKLEIGT